MNIINQTDTFKNWLLSLKDLRAKAQILQRIKRAQQGNFGEYRVLGDGISEMKINIGQGYRIYYARQANTIYLLLLGGNNRYSGCQEVLAKHPKGKPMNITQFDITEYLNNDEIIAMYLSEVLQNGSDEEFIAALNDIARAKGMNEIAKKSGISRESLYQTLSSEKPRFESVRKILAALNIDLIPTVKAI